MGCIRDQIRNLKIQHPRSPISDWVTISIGTATGIPSDDQTHFDLLREADEALYRAKAAGRDQVFHACEQMVADHLAVSTVPFDVRSSNAELDVTDDTGAQQTPGHVDGLTDIGA